MLGLRHELEPAGSTELPYAVAQAGAQSHACTLESAGTLDSTGKKKKNCPHGTWAAIERTSKADATLSLVFWKNDHARFTRGSTTRLPRNGMKPNWDP